jgi:aspartokinase/homoserine dehydrogenase 1
MANPEMKVLKFGGTSVGTSESIKIVLSIILEYRRQDQQVAVVVSALGGITNQLIEAGRKAAVSDQEFSVILKSIEKKHIQIVRDLVEVRLQSNIVARIKLLLNELEELLHGVYLLKELSPRTLDLILSFGERLSAFTISECLRHRGVEAEFTDTRFLIKTDKNFGKAKVIFNVTNENIQKHFKQKRAIQIITGFIGSTENQETTTLGRGGSDYTSSIIGAALNAEEIEIWTDVDGVMTADPRQVPAAFSLSSVSYSEAMEMSHFGAKVIYPPTLQPAFGANIPIRIKNTFRKEFPGTLISRNAEKLDFPVKGISSIADITLINVMGSGMVGVPGVASRLFGGLAAKDINVILITQASSEHSICFAVSPEEAPLAKEIIEEEFTLELMNRKIDQILMEPGHSIVAIIGENMRKTAGISGKMFNALGKNGINIAAIAQGSSELNISVVISRDNLSKALNSLHEAFFLSDLKTLNLYLVGTGLIGSTLLKQISKQYNYLFHEKKIKLNILGICNSRKMYFEPLGINLENWQDHLFETGFKADLSAFIRKIKELNLQNAVFVDCTSSTSVVAFYDEIINSSISIVTPNKLANSGRFSDYLSLRRNAGRHGVKFLYETNVGAGLPVITTMNDLKNSGDKVLKIEGVLSGTLSYIFNNFDEKVRFSEVVRMARDKGYTEPDPRQDLNGMDVARKILILSREVGYEMEPEDIQIENILPESCLKAETVEDFLQDLTQYDQMFEKRRKEAVASGKILRFIASLENGQASVKLVAVNSDHPFYHLSGGDNIISFTTERYKERPLVIQGPGAGAEVTAAGVFAEIISISNYLSNR